MIQSEKLNRIIVVKKFRLEDCGERGWFIGDFDRAVFRSKEFEVCYQENPRSKPDTHIHKEISEITLVISGQQIVNGQIMRTGDVYILEPGDVSQIEYTETTQVVTIKVPSIPSDKFYL